MEDISQLVHLPFFNENECLEIIKYIEDKEIYLKKNCSKEYNKNWDKNLQHTHYPEEFKRTIYNNYSTNLYYSYNFFKENIQYIPRLKNFLIKQFPYLKYPLMVQCWGNIYQDNQKILWHTHRIFKKIASRGLTSNIFIGGDENIGTTYAFPHKDIPRYNYVNVKNKLGYIQCVDQSIYHMVSENKSGRKRYSLGITITEFDVTYAKQFFNSYIMDECGILILNETDNEDKQLFNYS